MCDYYGEDEARGHAAFQQTDEDAVELKHLFV